MNETPRDPEEEAAEREAWEKSLTAGSLPAWWKPEEGGQPAAQPAQPQPQPAPPEPAAQAPAPPAPSAQPAPAPPAPVSGAPPEWQHSVTAGELPAWWKPGDAAPSVAPPVASAPAPVAAAPPAPPAVPTASDPAATVQMPQPVGGPALPTPAPAPPLADPEQRTMVLGTFPAAPPQARLTVRSGPDAGTSFSLGPEIAYLGRAKDNQLVVNDPATSRRHARFEVRDRRFILVDLGSANGSAIDGARVVLEQPLTDGCTIAIGQNEIEVAIG
jgi:hypothetical protein